MGINALFPFLKKHSKTVKISEFAGKIAAVDASCWIHKGLAVAIKRGNRESFIDIFSSYLSVLKKADVIPYIVFDGLQLPAKAAENERRNKERASKAKKAREGSNEDLSRRLLSQAASINHEDVTVCIKLCLKDNIKYVVSPYEADAQIAYLMKNKLADIAITEDSDLIAFGCEKVLTKLQTNGDGELFCHSSILKEMNLEEDKFLESCIMAGCDYLKNVRCVGIHTAFSWSGQEDVFDKLARKGAQPEYRMLFEQAKLAFLHQTIYDPINCETKPLNNWSTPPSKELQYFCGNYLDSKFATELSVGNIDPKSGKKINSFPIDNVLQIGNNHTPIQGISASLPKSDFEIKVTEITDQWQSWQIPCFPVMTVDFYNIKFQYNREDIDGLVMRGQTVCLGKMMCKQQVSIKINGEDRIVIYKPTRLSSRNEDLSAEQNCEADDTSDSEHTEHSSGFHEANFKVMGTCYCKTRQAALEEAYEHMYEHNRYVFARLQAEPENPADANAIAVLIKSSDEYIKVGYIARELTCHVKPYLTDSSLKVEVRNIRMSTTFLLAGFYVAIKITKKGAWHKQVERASKNVK